MEKAKEKEIKNETDCLKCRMRKAFRWKIGENSILKKMKMCKHHMQQNEKQRKLYKIHKK